MERIIYAAIKRSDRCIIFGKHHSECIQKSPKGTCLSGSVQGFITNLWRFVDREDAFRIAFNAGQIAEKPVDGSGLISEMLWSKRDGGKFNYNHHYGYVKRKV